MGNLKLIKDMKKKLGFGCMRLPIIDGNASDIDLETMKKMVDTFMENGFNYFDTAYPYHQQMSEGAVRKCLVDRYKREEYFLADKLPIWVLKAGGTPEDIFKTQLERTGAGYFDFYLLHALNQDYIDYIEENNIVDFVMNLKKEGKIKNVGFSFHDSAVCLDKFLTKHKDFDFVQLQINYYDWESKDVESRACYEIACKHELPVIVMEPVKGGLLANMSEGPANILKSLSKDLSIPSYAIRFAASLDNVMMVLSGMSNMEQLEDNISYMKDFKPLTSEEQNALQKVKEELAKLSSIPCTKCRYCVDGCPKNIVIPDLFEVRNKAKQFGLSDKIKDEYNYIVKDHGKASDCIKCGKCEGSCPQHIEIRRHLDEIKDDFE